MPTSNDIDAPVQASDMVQLSVVGETVLDLIEDSTDDDVVFRPRVGGAPLNVAVGARRLGLSTELLTPVAEDALALTVQQFLDVEGVRLNGFPGGPTTPLAVVQNRGEGGLAFSFYWDPRQPWNGTPDGLAVSGSIVHLGSAPLMTDRGYAAVRRIVDAHSGRVTVDPNYRPSLVPDAADYRRRVEALLPRVALLKLSDEDARGIWGVEDPESVALRLVDQGAEVVIVTQGALGARVATREGVAHVPTRPVAVADTTGAGDSFMAALLVGLVEQPHGVAAWSELVATAHRAAGLTCQAVGGASSMPTALALTAEETLQ